MTGATTLPSTAVEVTDLVDGRLVTLRGPLDPSATRSLRMALLSVLPPGSRDLLVDAGQVTTVCEATLTVLLAAPSWAAQHGCRFGLTRASAVLREALMAVGLLDEVPALPALHTRIPEQRQPALA